MAAAVAFGVGSASPGEDSGCDPKRTRTLVETDDARVFTRVVGEELRLSACWFDDGKPHLLWMRPGRPEARIALAGRYLAYLWYSRSCCDELRVFDIRRGRRVRTVQRDLADFTLELGSFVVNDRGSVAWTVFGDGRLPDYTVSVHRWDSNGPAKLDEGKEIMSGSLAIAEDSRLDRSIVYWGNGFGGDIEARSAPLE
jgi:hypothetical protein